MKSNFIEITGDIANRISVKRALLKISQAELAKRIGVKAPSVTNWEKRRRTPNIEHLVKLEEMLELNVLTKEFIKAYRKENK